MSNISKSTPTHEEIQREAVEILEEFNNPLEPFNASMAYRSLIKIMLDLAGLGDGAISNENEQFFFYKMLSIVQQAEDWHDKRPNPMAVINELEKQGITTLSIDELFNYICNKLDRRKDYQPEHRKLLRSLWKMLRPSHETSF